MTEADSFGGDRARLTYADFYHHGPLARFPHELRAAPGRYAVQMVRAEQNSHATEDPPTPDLLLGLVLGGQSRARWSWGGRWNETSARLPGQFGLSPPNLAGRFEVHEPNVMLVLSLPLERLKRDLDDDSFTLPREFRDLHDRYREDRFVQDVSLRLWAEGQTGESPVACLCSDALVMALMRHLCHLVEPTPPSRRSTSLSKGRLRRIVEFVSENPLAQVSLSGLATAAGLSLRDFHRQFRASTGQSPHQFIIQRQIRLAQSFLQSTKEPVADIAVLTGFTDASHLTRHFTRHVGVTPGRYRASIWTQRRSSAKLRNSR